jgi:hypothetical protein
MLRLRRRLLFCLGLTLPFLLLFLLQRLLLFGVLLQQLLGLLLMLLLDLLFFGGIGPLLRYLCVFLLLLLLDCLAFLQLLRAELILFLLVPSVQLGVRGRWDSGSRWRRSLARMCDRCRWPIGWLRRVMRIGRLVWRTVRRR